MDSQRWRRVRDLFDQAVDWPVDQRAQRLEHACAGDSELRAEVESMLAADAASASTQVIGDAAPDLLQALDEAERASQHDALLGQRLGAWRLVRLLGRGGMGAVYLAERDDGQYRQQAAIKLVRAGWDAEDLLQRFRAERQILAQLNHPNIARLLDGGVSTDGKPFLVLEYVDGHPIGEHCDSLRLPLRPRLDLFLTVCDAVAHAHRSLVVHRDLKPSNILVDHGGQVKLLDFGIARLLPEGGAAAHTGTRVFTPEYAAPEQVRGGAITTGVDVHALGLLLFELLTGRRPFATPESTPAAYEQAILSQEPPWPSRVITGVDASASAAARRLAPTELSAHLRGDLDAIVLKALRKEPVDRYASVEALASDVRRYLAQEPVTARRGNLRYRATRFLQRHALAAALASLALLLLVTGLAATLWQARLLSQQRDIAQAEAGKAQAVAEFLTDVFAKADPANTDGVIPSARDLLAKAVTDLDAQTDLGADQQANLLASMGRAYDGLGDSEQAQSLLHRALGQAQVSGDARTQVQVRASLASVLINASRYQPALDQLRAAQTLLSEHALAEPLLAARLDRSLGATWYNLGEYEQALTHLQRAHPVLAGHYGAAADEVAPMIPVLASTLISLGRAADALPFTEATYRAAQAMPTLPLARRALIVSAHGLALDQSRRYVEGEAMAREALDLAEQIYGVGDPQTSSALNNLAVSLRNLDRLKESAELMEQVLALRRKSLTPDHQRIAETLINTALIQQLAGNWPRAQELIDEGLAVCAMRDIMTSRVAIRGVLAQGLQHEQRGELELALTQLAQVLLYTQGKNNFYPGEKAAAPLLIQARLLHQLERLPADCAPLPQVLAFANLREELAAEATILAAHCTAHHGPPEQAQRLRAAALALTPPPHLHAHSARVLARLRQP